MTMIVDDDGTAERGEQSEGEKEFKTTEQTMMMMMMMMIMTIWYNGGKQCTDLEIVRSAMNE